MPATRLPASRACDGCKRRKVKCNAAKPCANCGIAHLECTYSIPQRKRGPKSAAKKLKYVTSLPPQTSSVSSPDPSTPQAPSLQSAFEPSNNQTIPTPSLDATLTPTPTSALFDGIASTGPHMAESLQFISTIPESVRSPRSIQEGLFISLLSSIPSSVSILDVVNHCIDLYMQYNFPTAPLVHEPSLRANALEFFSEPPSTLNYESGDQDHRVAQLRGFALVTALCAAILSVMPESLIPYRNDLVRPFLKASRETLRSFEDWDLEHPNAASMTIRMFHSSALHHLTGKHGAAWHVHSQAAIIAQNLRLYSEESLDRLEDPIERQLLRLNFWHMYGSDQMAAAFRVRAFVLQDSLFIDELTLNVHPEQHIPLMDPSGPAYDETFECRLLEGFHLFEKMSSVAGNLVIDMQKHGPPCDDHITIQFGQRYLEYTGLLDLIPPWMRISHLDTMDDQEEKTRFHKQAFWVQRCTILVSFYCLWLVILRQCVHGGMPHIAGISNEPRGMSMKLIEIATDFLQVLEDIPYIYLRVKGEPNVERIRRAGSIILELEETVNNETLKIRAKEQSRRLLDILVKLDSKVSDNLGETLELETT